MPDDTEGLDPGLTADLRDALFVRLVEHTLALIEANPRACKSIGESLARILGGHLPAMLAQADLVAARVRVVGEMVADLQALVESITKDVQGYDVQTDKVRFEVGKVSSEIKTLRERMGKAHAFLTKLAELHNATRK